jgi:hypothetical protein
MGGDWFYGCIVGAIVGAIVSIYMAEYTKEEVVGEETEVVGLHMPHKWGAVHDCYLECDDECECTGCRLVHGH